MYIIRFYLSYEGYGIIGYCKVIVRVKMLVIRGIFECLAGVGIRVVFIVYFDEVGKGLCLFINSKVYCI